MIFLSRWPRHSEMPRVRMVVTSRAPTFDPADEQPAQDMLPGDGVLPVGPRVGDEVLVQLLRDPALFAWVSAYDLLHGRKPRRGQRTKSVRHRRAQRRSERENRS